MRTVPILIALLATAALLARLLAARRDEDRLAAQVARDQAVARQQ